MTEVQYPSSAWFDAAFDPYIATDAAGLIVEWNRAAMELLGWTREQAVGQPLEALVIPPRHREQYRAGLEHYQATGESSTFDRRLAIVALTCDGQEIPVEITTWAGEAGGGRFNAFLRDLRSRDAASALQELHAAVVRSSQDAIITKTLQGIITSWNPGAEKILGYTAEEAVGKSILMLIPL